MGLDRATCKYWNDWVPPLGCCQTAFRPEMELLVIRRQQLQSSGRPPGQAWQGTPGDPFRGGEGRLRLSCQRCWRRAGQWTRRGPDDDIGTHGEVKSRRSWFELKLGADSPS